MNDEFFDDEQELMEAQVAAASEDTVIVEDAAAPADAEAPECEPSARRDAPPFWMVLAIAAISLVLGVVIGYLVGTTATISKLESESAQMSQAQVGAGDASSATLPDGHPQLAINEDGSASLADDASSES